MAEGTWMQAGVWNCEQLNPDPFMAAVGQLGLPWQEEVLVQTPFLG